MPARTKARKQALDILFEADLRGLPITEVLSAHLERDEPQVRPFTLELINGVVANASRIEEELAAGLPPSWTLSRMPRVDRCLARLAAYELLFTEVDPAVVISQCVTLATELSTDDSPAFLNGVLGTLARGVNHQG